MRVLKLISIIFLFAIKAVGQNDTTKMTNQFGTKADIIFSVVEVMPEYPGGITELHKFLKSELHYPKHAKPGQVFVSFIVSENGSVEKNSIEVIRGNSTPLNNEAIRVIGLMPNWKPGFQDNKPVRVRFTIPIDFHR